MFLFNPRKFDSGNLDQPSRDIMLKLFSFLKTQAKPASKKTIMRPGC